MADHIEFLVEEPSMEAALRELLPRIIGDMSFAIYPHQCKEDLLTSLPKRLRGYSSWIPQGYCIVVVVDGDDDDCLELKERLEESARGAGLISRSRSGNQPYQVVNRIAIEELEAWFFGDWNAVCTAYPNVNPNIPRKQGFRDPDQITGGTWEALERVLMRAGHFKTGLRKIEASRSIGKYMDPTRNRSRSFQKFRDALMEITSRVRHR